MSRLDFVPTALDDHELFQNEVEGAPNVVRLPSTYKVLEDLFQFSVGEEVY